MIEVLALALGLSLFINIAMFLVAFKIQSDKLTDISYAVTFAVIAVAAGIWSGWTPVLTLAIAIIGVWAVRLGGFLLYRVSVTGKDARFDEMRGNFWKFGQFWLLQAVTVWVLMLGVTVAVEYTGAIGTVSIIGAVISLVGIVIEATADFQKFAFTRKPSNKGKWIQEGIWKYSRHPNYFGEILMWIGIFIIVAPILPLGWLLVAAVSPVGIATLLLFVSGIPILEKGADARWGRIEEYKKYKRRTSILIPLPPKK